jgi:hypothetical protein
MTAGSVKNTHRLNRENINGSNMTRNAATALSGDTAADGNS